MIPCFSMLGLMRAGGGLYPPLKLGEPSSHSDEVRDISRYWLMRQVKFDVPR